MFFLYLICEIIYSIKKQKSQEKGQFMKKYFFCGIAGAGMEPLAIYLKRKGNIVVGSDRSFDLKLNGDLFAALKKEHIDIFHQDGSGVTEDVDVFVTSTAVEETILDVQKAKQLHLSFQKRAELFADILQKQNGIAVSGTSGKSTTAGMIGHILHTLHMMPTLINGAELIGSYGKDENPNLLVGDGQFCVMEADESDGSIDYYTPSIAVVTNISLDHKPISDLTVLFDSFIKRATVGAVINADCPNSSVLKEAHENISSFSVLGKKEASVRATHIKQTKDGLSFIVNQMTEVHLPLFGRHNVENALAALAALELIGISYEQSAKALSSFRGMKRRLELLGAKKGIRVYDDFAHNPEKIKASLETLISLCPNGRIWSIFCPHGFKPTRLMRKGYVDVFSKILRPDDVVLMPEIFYQGGTTVQDISSSDLITDIRRTHPQAYFNKSREDFLGPLTKKVKEGDIIVVMGARDRTLTDFAHLIYEKL